jgi:glyoxylase-like metal-dependent hydrolase (beta-lactamase superfamily II)
LELVASSPAVELAPNVWRIPTVPFDFVNTFALVDEDGSVTLVDAGLRRAPARIVAGLAAIGKRPADVSRILLTHAHLDHAAGAAELAERTGAPVAVPDADADWAARGTPPPPDPSTFVGRLMRRMPGQGFPPIEVGERLQPDSVLDIAGGLRIVSTPGHSPGHVSLLHEPSRVLITGDALFNALGIRWPPKWFCTDFTMTKQTAHVLGELDYDLAAFTHGEEIRENARERVRGFLVRRG